MLSDEEISRVFSNNVELLINSKTTDVATLAHTAGVSRQAIYNYKKGSIPSMTVLARWHGALGLDINWLLTGKGKMLVDTVAIDGGYSNKLALELAELSKENRELRQELDILRKNIGGVGQEVRELARAAVHE